MTRRNKIIIIISVILGIIAVVFLVLSISDEQLPIENINTNINLQGINTIGGSGLSASINIAPVVPAVVTNEPSTQTTLIALAITVAEKFGTYSSESNFENIKDIEKMMTPELISWSENYIQQTKLSENDFYGITTKSLNAQIITLNDQETEAQILVNTQRSEVVGSYSSPRIFYQKLSLVVSKISDEWKVSKLDWQ